MSLVQRIAKSMVTFLFAHNISSTSYHYMLKFQIAKNSTSGCSLSDMMKAAGGGADG